MTATTLIRKQEKYKLLHFDHIKEQTRNWGQNIKTTNNDIEKKLPSGGQI